MKITILGCGGAGGVPLIGNVWGACDPHEPKNRRLRVSILIEEEGGVGGEGGSASGKTTLLVDTSPDMREQLLRANLQDLSAILFTHPHADHVHGIDNVRSLNWLLGRSIDIYAGPETLTDLRTRFAYIIDQPPLTNKFIRPSVETHLIDVAAGPFAIGSVRVTPFLQQHGAIHSMGYRLNDFGYSTDASELDDCAFEILKGVKVWVVGAIREREHPTHANVDKALRWIERVRPERAYLTHMDQSLDYATLKARLPAGVEPCYDGLEIEC